MKIEYIHASKYGNGAEVAEEFRKQMDANGVSVSVHHIRDVNPHDLPPADLYVFSAPGRFGKPKGEMRRALKKLQLAAGSKYAVLTTEAAPPIDKETGQTKADGGCGGRQRVIPIMNEILGRKGVVKVAEDTILVHNLKGPLEEGWKEKVAAFAARIPMVA